MVYILRFFLSSKCSLFHNSNIFGSCIIHILYTGCAKIKKYNSDAKRLTVEEYVESQVEMREETHVVIHVKLPIIAAQFEWTLDYVGKC